MTSKQKLRLAFSPILFILGVAIMVVLPIGIITFFMGVIKILGRVFIENEDRDELADDLAFTFTFFVGPYFSAKEFVLTGKIE